MFKIPTVFAIFADNISAIGTGRLPAYEVWLQEEADCNEVMWGKVVTGHTTVTIGVVYRCKA